MPLISANKAKKYFESKLEFTCGPVELHNMIQSGENIAVIDVRAYEDYTNGHIPGAVTLPKDKWDSFEGLNHDKLNIVYCYSEVCHLAATAALHFAERGYPVMELEGGFDEWKKHAMPIES